MDDRSGFPLLSRCHVGQSPDGHRINILHQPKPNILIEIENYEAKPDTYSEHSTRTPPSDREDAGTRSSKERP
jgi:hypothetical protein